MLGFPNNLYTHTHTLNPFASQATDTSMGSNGSTNDSFDLASMLPPPRMSIDVDLANADTAEPSHSSATPKHFNGGVEMKKRSQSSHIVKFGFGDSAEEWMITDEGAIRLDDYTRGNSGAEGQQVTSLNPADFVKVGEVGRGAGGIVTKALHIPTFSLVAIKSMPIGNPSKRQQTRNELQVLYSQLKGLETKAQFPWGHIGGGKVKEFRSDDIVSFYDAYSTEDGYINIVMEYLEGGSLQDLISRGGCTNHGVLKRIALGVSRALSFLSDKSLLHRDVKPANVLLSVSGDVKLADFGISRDLSSTKELAQTFIGTFLYMSPERIASKPYNIAADVWGLGMTLLR